MSKITGDTTPVGGLSPALASLSLPKASKNDDRALAEEEEANKNNGWWGRLKGSFKPKPMTIKDIVNSASSSEVTYKFEFTDFELDVLSNTTDEASKDAKNMYSVLIQRSSMASGLTQQGESKWAGPAASFQSTNEKLAEMRRQLLDWELNGQQQSGEEGQQRLSPDDIKVQAEGSFFGIASSPNQGLEYVRCPTDFGTVKEAERYIVRHRWAPSFNVIPIVTNIKRHEQLEETDPFGENADTSPAAVNLSTLADVGSADGKAGKASDVLALGGTDDEDESPFERFHADPNGLGANAGSGFPGYNQAHRRHTATYGGLVGIQQAVANHHQRTMSYGVGATKADGGGGSTLPSPSRNRNVKPPESPGSPMTTHSAFADGDDLSIHPYITYNQTTQNCTGEDSTPFISTIGVNPCEAVAAKHKPKPNSSVTITIKERTDVDLSSLGKLGIAPIGGGFGAVIPTIPGNSGRKFTQIRLDLTKASIAAFGGQRYELYFFDDSEEAKKERKKIKGKSGITGGLVPTLVLRFKVQGTMLDKDTLEDVTSQSPARRRLLTAKVSEAPAFPYAFVLDQFAIHRNVKTSYNIAAGMVKVLSGTGVAEVNVGPDGKVYDAKEKERDEKEKKQKEKKDKKDKGDKEKDDKDKKESPPAGADDDDSGDENDQQQQQNQQQCDQGNAANATAAQTTPLTRVTRMQPLYLRNMFKLCDIEDDDADDLLGVGATATPNFTAHGSSSNAKAEGGAGPGADALSTASPAKLSQLVAGAGKRPLKFEDLYDCFVVTPQFATMRSMTVGDLFQSNTEEFAAHLAEHDLPPGITNDDVGTLMQRALIKMQCKTEAHTCKMYTQAVQSRGSHMDFVLGSACTDGIAGGAHPGAPLTSSSATAGAEQTPSTQPPAGDPKEVATRAYNTMLHYPNTAVVQAISCVSLVPFVNLNTMPLEGITVSTTFPRKHTNGLGVHHYEDEVVSFRIRRFLLPSVIKAGLAPQTIWDIPIDAFENEECPYRVHEPVLSLESFFEPLRNTDDL